jgi:hypothetical protein
MAPRKLFCGPACKRLISKERQRAVNIQRRALIPPTVRKFETFKLKDSIDLPPPSRRQREIMLENLCRLFLDTGDEVKLIFGEASMIGSGHCKTGGEE